MNVEERKVQRTRKKMKVMQKDHSQEKEEEVMSWERVNNFTSGSQEESLKTQDWLSKSKPAKKTKTSFCREETTISDKKISDKKDQEAKTVKESQPSLSNAEASHQICVRSKKRLKNCVLLK